MSAPTAVKASRPRPHRTDHVADIYRTDLRRLRIERVQYLPDTPFFLNLAVVRLGRAGDWFRESPGVSIRAAEYEQVAHLLLAEARK